MYCNFKSIIIIFLLSLHNVGVAHRHYEDLDLALESYKEYLYIYTLKENGHENLDIARTLNNVGMTMLWN